MKHILLISAAGLALSACTTPTAYGPATQQKGAGYLEQRIETGRYRVTFSGAGDRRRIEDLALRRAAELTLQDGYDWFRVTGRSGDSGPGNGPAMSVGLGTGNYGYNSGVSLGLGTSFNLGAPRSSASIEVVLGRGPKPSAPDAYDARDVLANVR